MKTYVTCITNSGYEASLELGSSYEKVEDKIAEAHGFVRVIDESGEDYLFPAEYFGSVLKPDIIVLS